eukprot:7886461-Pyramimonas_sp.AAC.1
MNSTIVPLEHSRVLSRLARDQLDDGLRAVADDSCVSVGAPAPFHTRVPYQLKEALRLDLASDGLGGLVQADEDGDLGSALDGGRKEAAP